MCGKVLAVLAGQVRLMPVFIGIYHLVWGEGKGFDLYSYVVTSAAWAFTKLSCRTWRAPRTLPWTWRELRHSIESGSNLHLTLSARTLFSNSPLPSYDLLGLLTLPRSTFLLLRINKKARREGGSQGTSLSSGQSWVIDFALLPSIYWTPTKWWPWEYNGEQDKIAASCKRW